MRYNQLGDSDLKISELCLGTMTFGQQNTIQEAHQQLDYAIERGVNFIDTAEMYPVPPREETYGVTEMYVGEWLKHQQREKIVIATKIIGAGSRFQWVRGGTNSADRKNIKQAVEDSLKRLQTDYIDLYQIHWPDRYVPIFGQTVFDVKQERPTIPIAEQLSVFAELIQEGKIRYIGLSNETPWGVCEFSHAAKQLGLPKVVSIQNAYNLLNRVFDSALAEVCYRENISLIAYSPLGFGTLSGKYIAGETPNTRLSLFPGFGQRYLKINVSEAVASYADIAKHFNLSPVTLALAFVRSRWFVTSTIIGATNLSQLKENLDSVDVDLAPEIISLIDRIHARYPNPSP